MRLVSANILEIEGISEPLVLDYFNTINQADYQSTARLFTPQGSLIPPFESPISGREAIATYLTQEAQGMLLYPKKGTVEILPEQHRKITIKGKVQTPIFGVNVAWQFIITSEPAILAVEVKLLASPQELLSLRG